MKKSLRCICAAIFMLVFCTGFVIHASAVERASLYLTRYSATVSASNNGTIEIKIFVVANIYPDLKTPSNIPRLYLEIDDGTDTLPSEIKDPNQISKICNLLSNVELSYHGDYSGMQYYPSKGDFIM